MLILLQQVTEGQLIKSTGKKREKDGLPQFGVREYAARGDRPAILRLQPRPVPSYFALLSVVGISTLKTCKRIWVPDSSLTLSVFDTITGPGVLALGAVLRLKPFSPLTPSGVPMLMGELPGVVSSWADEPSAWLLGDCFTVIEGCIIVVSDAPDMEAFEEEPDCPRLDNGLLIPPTGAVPLSLVPTIIDGGSIWEG